jgi:putative two-component system hydrogenase maturation factor HypX/HoxX
MKILLVATAYNSLTQRVHVELDELGHEISVELALNEAVVSEAAALFQPDLILAPMLKTPIAEEVWRNYRCIIIHPGPKGDRGPSSLDWAISLRAAIWGHASAGNWGDGCGANLGVSQFSYARCP